jgi:hypothetical protein
MGYNHSVVVPGRRFVGTNILNDFMVRQFPVPTSATG